MEFTCHTSHTKLTIYRVLLYGKLLFVMLKYKTHTKLTIYRVLLYEKTHYI